MKKLLCIIAFALILSLTLVLASCGEDEPAEPTVTVSDDGYVVVNGVKTEYKVDTTDEISVNADGYVVVNGVTTEIVADKDDIITVNEEGFVIVNGVKTEHKVSTYDKKHAHVLSDWGNNTATCEEDGTETRNCTVDGCYYQESRVSNALNHRFDGEICIVCSKEYTQGLHLEFDGSVYYLLGWDDENGFSACTIQDLIIPSVINGYPVIIEEPKTLSFNQSIATITFMEGWTRIEQIRRFEELTTINIPRSVNWINTWSSFTEECYKLEDINVDSTNPYYASIDGVLYSNDGATLIKYPCGKKETHFKIFDEVTIICSYAFSECKSLASVEIPNDVTTIGAGAFRYCDNLTDIYYCGTEEKWNEIVISYGNDALTKATIHYNYTPEE